MQSKYYVLCLLICFCFSLGLSQQYGAVLLGDVKALTLQKGYYTTGRRNAPVPQLQCVGGTAGCQAFVPEVVQCINMGPDGMDYQWECKTEMDKKYKFGKISVTCEGFNDPQDPYVLKGSCGLEYTLDLTEWGSKGSHQHSSYGRTYKSDSHKQRTPADAPDGWAVFIFLVIIIAIVVLVYKYNTQEIPPVVYPQPPQPPIYGFTDHTQPPPYGFRNQPPPPSAGFGSSPPPYGFKEGTDNHSNSSQGGFGGFWTGTGVGGVLGYLFGSRTNRASYQAQEPYGSSYFGNTRDCPGSQSESGSSSPSSTRTASGFGGTKRR